MDDGARREQNRHSAAAYRRRRREGLITVAPFGVTPRQWASLQKWATKAGVDVKESPWKRRKDESDG